MALLGWLDDSRNPTLWIIVIYPLLIFFLSLACHFRMNRLVQSLPLAPDESEKTKEAECSTTEETSVEYDLVSTTSADNVTGRMELSGGNSPALGVQGTRVPSPRDEFSRHNNVKQVAEEISRHNHSEFIKGVLIYSLQLLLAHRLGVSITR